MSILRTLQPWNYTGGNWRFVVQAWFDAVEQLLRLTALIAVIAAAAKYLA